MKYLALLAMFMALPLMAQEPAHCGAYYYVPAVITPRHNPGAPRSIHIILPHTMLSPDADGNGGGPLEADITIANGALLRWQGMACDEVWIPVGSNIRVTNPKKLWGDVMLPDLLYTIGSDGYLTYQYAPKTP